MKAESSKYLDPDRTPLERDSTSGDRYLDPDQTPLENPLDPNLDPDLSPLGEETIASLLKKTFGAVQDVMIDDLRIRRVDSTVEIYDGGKWMLLPEERTEEVRRAIEKFKELQRG